MSTKNSTSKAAVCIRQFHNDDLPEVAAIFEYGMMLYSKNDPASRQHWADYVRKSLNTDLADVQGTYMATGGNFWVATIEDSDGESKVAGMIAVEPKGNGDGEVRRVSVHPGYQRMGIGRSLMTHLVQWATTHGFKTLSLSSTYTDKTSAIAFYASFGFKMNGSFGFWEDPTHKMFSMVKTLP
jgi:ribosomal protein S18 acetylase RimI-like enzyme